MCIRDSVIDVCEASEYAAGHVGGAKNIPLGQLEEKLPGLCLLYTSDAADERSSVDLGGRRIIKKKNRRKTKCAADT